MKAQTLVTLALVVLVLVYGIQAMQLISIKEQVQSGNIRVSAASVPTQSGQPALPSNIQNLPTMVGGC